MNIKYKRSGYSLGETVQFHGVHQLQEFPVHIGSDVGSVVKQACSQKSVDHYLVIYDKTVPGCLEYVQELQKQFADVGVLVVVLSPGESVKDIKNMIN